MTRRRRLEFPLQEAVSDIRLRHHRRDVDDFDDTTPTPMAFAVSVGPKKPERCGDWIQTATGRQFYPLDPRVEDVSLDDIATSLSKICRWGGHINNDGVFSVAQHCVLVALNCPHRFRREALLHDAHEAYLFDAPRPIKRYLVNYDIIALRLDHCISDRFGVELVDLPEEVKRQDDRCLATERRDLVVKTDWEVTDAQGGRTAPWRATITPWTPYEARAAFLGLAWRLGLK